MGSGKKRVLLFASKLGYQTRSYDEAAQKLGVELGFVTDRCHRLEDPWGDRAIAVHFEKPEEAAATVLEKLKGESVEGVLVAGDRPSVAAAHAARGLGIPHNHPLSVEACRSKPRMREVFREAGLPVPWFRTLRIHPAPEPALHGIEYPCVLKPLSLSASQGVMRANNRGEFLTAAARLRRLLESAEVRATREAHLDEMIVEGYIPGREVAVEGLLTEGTLKVLAIFDKADPLEGPFFEETIYVTPARGSVPEQAIIERAAQEATRAIGLSRGAVHAEFRLNDEGAWPIEVAPRPIGGLCSKALRFCAGGPGGKISLEELLLRHELGELEKGFEREAKASGVMMIPVPQSGILKRVEGMERAGERPGIAELVITARIGDYVAAWPEGSSYLGFLFAGGDSPEAVEAALREAHACLSFEFIAKLPVEHPVAGPPPT